MCRCASCRCRNASWLTWRFLAFVLAVWMLLAGFVMRRSTCFTRPFFPSTRMNMTGGSKDSVAGTGWILGRTNPPRCAAAISASTSRRNDLWSSSSGIGGLVAMSAAGACGLRRPKDVRRVVAWMGASPRPRRRAASNRWMETWAEFSMLMMRRPIFGLLHTPPDAPARILHRAPRSE